MAEAANDMHTQIETILSNILTRVNAGAEKK